MKKSLLTNEKGATTILVAIALVVLLGFTALVTDVGLIYAKRAELQDYSDALALAGGQELPYTEQAKAVVKEYAQKNGIQVIGGETPISGGSRFTIDYKGLNGTLDILFTNSNYVMEVKLNIETPLFFARVLGHNEAQVPASATVATGRPLSMAGEGLLPIGVADNSATLVANTEIALNWGPHQVEQGNFCWLNLDQYYDPGEPVTNLNAVGNSVLRRWLESGYGSSTDDVNSDRPLFVGGTIATSTGGGWNPTYTSISTRFSCSCAYCNGSTSNISEVEGECKRLVTVPLIDPNDYTNATGVEGVTITGFAQFYLIPSTEDNLIRGIFISRLESGGGVAPGPTEDYEIEALRLIK